MCCWYRLEKLFPPHTAEELHAALAAIAIINRFRGGPCLYIREHEEEEDDDAKAE